MESFPSGSPDQLGPTQKGPAWHGEVQPRPGQRGNHAKPDRLRPKGQWSLSTSTPLHLFPFCQRGGQHGRQLRQLGRGAPFGDEVEDGGGGVRRSPSLSGLWRPGIQCTGAAF